MVVRNDLLALLLAYVPPDKAFVAWYIEDPRCSWMAIIVFFLSNLGILAILEEDLGVRF